MKNFNFIDRKNVYDDLEVSDEFQIKRIGYGEFSYLRVDNF